jgi:hypothetical protein
MNVDPSGYFAFVLPLIGVGIIALMAIIALMIYYTRNMPEYRLTGVDLKGWLYTKKPFMAALITLSIYENIMNSARISSINRRLYQKYRNDVRKSAGKSDPGSLEKGMSNKQKGLFQRAIEDFKESNGMPPNYNLPYALLIEIANEIRKNFK